MGQRISIQIAGRPYELTATSPEHEEIIRKAADEVNKRIAQYQGQFPTSAMSEIMSFTALNISMSNLILQMQVKGMKDAEDSLARELDSYLKNIDNTSR